VVFTKLLRISVKGLEFAEILENHSKGSNTTKWFKSFMMWEGTGTAKCSLITF
jgi:hypothetical protein